MKKTKKQTKRQLLCKKCLQKVRDYEAEEKRIERSSKYKIKKIKIK
jgi:hypothetical protein